MHFSFNFYAFSVHSSSIPTLFVLYSSSSLPDFLCTTSKTHPLSFFFCLQARTWTRTKYHHYHHHLLFFFYLRYMARHAEHYTVSLIINVTARTWKPKIQKTWKIQFNLPARSQFCGSSSSSSLFKVTKKKNRSRVILSSFYTSFFSRTSILLNAVETTFKKRTKKSVMTHLAGAG